MSITTSTQVSRVPGVLSTRVADQAVLLSEELRYLALDHVGQAIWDLLEEPRTVQALVDDLVERFDVTEERCRADVVTFLSDLHRHGVVTLG